MNKKWLQSYNINKSLFRCFVSFHNVAEIIVNVLRFRCQHQFVVGEFLYHKYSAATSVLNFQQLLVRFFRYGVSIPFRQAVCTIVGYTNFVTCKVHSYISFRYVFLSCNGYFVRLCSVNPFANNNFITIIVFFTTCEQHCAHSKYCDEFDDVVCHIDYVFDD